MKNRQSVVLHVRVPFVTARRIRMLAMERGQSIGSLLDDLVSREPVSDQEPNISAPVKVDGNLVSCVDVLGETEDEVSLSPHLRDEDVPRFVEIASRFGRLNPNTRRYQLKIEVLPELVACLKRAKILAILSSSVEHRLRLAKGER